MLNSRDKHLIISGADSPAETESIGAEIRSKQLNRPLILKSRDKHLIVSGADGPAETETVGADPCRSQAGEHYAGGSHQAALQVMQEL